MGRAASSITAAATTEPANGPRPASSTPATSLAIEFLCIYTAPFEFIAATMSRHYV